MARKRRQMNGDVYEQGGYWKLRWREDVFTDDKGIVRKWSKPIWIGKATGPGALSKSAAKDLAYENHLSKLTAANRSPQTLMTLQEFIARKFYPEHVDRKRKSGREHYDYILNRFVIPALGKSLLREIEFEHIQGLVRQIESAGFSTQTITHVRNVASKIFNHAKKHRLYTGENPCSLVDLPQMKRKRSNALTADQASDLLNELDSPLREFVKFAIMTSMNIAEIQGLKWKWVNLTDQPRVINDTDLPAAMGVLYPGTIGVRYQWYRGEFGPVKVESRLRDIPLTADMIEDLRKLQATATITDGEEFVFASRTGRPIDEHNMMARNIKPAAEKRGLHVSWHVFRRAHTTIRKELNVSLESRMKSMGHSEARMTLLYTKDSLDSQREEFEVMSARLKVKAAKASS